MFDRKRNDKNILTQNVTIKSFKSIVVYLKSPRRRRKKNLLRKRIAQDIVVYLKSPRRRREKISLRKRIARGIVVYLKSPRRRREQFLS